jgi:DNA-binding NarL/FixJ family response regulator
MENACQAPGACPGVLIVDQDELWRGLCERLIRELDPRWLVWSSSVDEALARLALFDSPPDLVIVEPADDQRRGVGFICALRNRFNTVPVLALTDDTSAETLMETIRAGVSGYLLKGNDTDALRQAMTQVMSGACPVSPALGRHLFALARSGNGDGLVSPSGATVQRLSPREEELLRHLSRASSYTEAASAMGITLSTVQSHVRRLYRKLSARSRIQAVNLARARGLI